MTDLSGMSDDELKELAGTQKLKGAFAAQPPRPLEKMSDDELKAMHDQMAAITGPAGDNPAYHQAVAETPPGSVIPGPVFAGRGLPGGSVAEKGANLATAGLGAAVGPMVAAIAGAGAPTAAASSMAAQGMTPELIALLKGAGEKEAPGLLAKSGKFVAKHFLEGLPLGAGLGISEGGLSMVKHLFGGK